MSRSILLVLLALLLASCSDSPFFVTTEDVSIRASGETIQLTNRAAETLYFNVIAIPMPPTLDVWPCVDTANCTGIAPGQRLDIPYPEIINHQSGSRKALLTWWFLQPEGDGYRVVRLQSQTVEL